MKRFWTAAAVALLGVGMLAGCNDYNNSVQYNTGATITNISPSALPAGTPQTGNLPNCPNTPSGKTNPCFTLFVIGSAVNGFQTTTLVQWNNGRLPACTLTTGNANTNASNGCSTYVDPTEMTAYIPYTLIKAPGTAYVNVWTPQSGTGNNGLSNALSFIIYGAANPVPSISTISPTSAAYCAYNANSPTSCPAVSITVSGSNFLPVSTDGGSSVTFTGAATYNVETAINVSSISSSSITASIPGNLLCAVDNIKINVINPPSAICIVNCPDLGGGNTNVPTSNFSISGAAGTNSCPPQTPPNPVPGVVEETPAISHDGRFVVYTSNQNKLSQILMHDTCIGLTSECTPSTQTVSVSNEGTVANGDNHDAVMTSDGRYVAFSSAATNLVSNPPSGRQVYLRDTCQGVTTTCKPTTTLISVDEQGKLTGTEAILPSISTSGRFVAFLAITPSHTATNSKSSAAATATTNSGLRQVFVRDTCLGATNCTPATTRISLNPGDSTPGTTKPAGPALSGLARQLAISDSKSSTVFTNTVPIDDQVFLAIRKD